MTTESDAPGEGRVVSTTYRHLAEDVRPGDRLLVDDGLIELRVLETDGVRARCQVVEGGVLKEHKGINLPGVTLRAEALGEKDLRDLAFGLSHGVDYVALSFVRSPEDIQKCRAAMERAGRVVPIIAKLEKPEALASLDAVIAVSDGVMVARGDLGVEIEPESVPSIQKQILRKANAAGKPVIVATQMLESMIQHPRPTRAEANEVANAIWDGADAVMLSAETASGQHPLLALQIMDRIVREAEKHLALSAPPVDLWDDAGPFNAVTAAAAMHAALAARAVAIACFTISGTTARLLSQQRPHVPIIAFSPDQAIRRRMAFYWGVEPKIMEPVGNSDIMCEMVSRQLLADGVAERGDRIVLVFGSPLGVPGQTKLDPTSPDPTHGVIEAGERARSAPRRRRGTPPAEHVLGVEARLHLGEPRVGRLAIRGADKLLALVPEEVHVDPAIRVRLERGGEGAHPRHLPLRMRRVGPHAHDVHHERARRCVNAVASGSTRATAPPIWWTCACESPGSMRDATRRAFDQPTSFQPSTSTACA